MIKIKEERKEFIKTGVQAFICCAFVFVMLFFAALLQGCQTTRQTDVQGKAVIITTDTTVINHSTLIKYPKK